MSFTNFCARSCICIFTLVIAAGHASAQSGTNAGIRGVQGEADSEKPKSAAQPQKFSPLAESWLRSDTKSTGNHEADRRLVILEDDDVWDGDLAALRLMPEVNRVVLMHHFSEKGLARLSGLKSIEYLRLEYDVGVTDQELEGIATLPNLRELEIVQAGIGLPNIGDKGLETLSRLPHLEVLELSGVEVTEDGLRHLKKFPELRELRLASTKLTWDSLSKFPKLDKLRTLQITCYDPALLNDILRTHNSR